MMTYIRIMIAKILNDLYIQNYKKTAKRNQRRYREIKRHPFTHGFQDNIVQIPMLPKVFYSFNGSLSKFQKNFGRNRKIKHTGIHMESNKQKEAPKKQDSLEIKVKGFLFLD